MSIEHVLNTLLKRTFIKYRIINKNIVLFTEDDAATLAKEMDGQLADSKVQVIEQDKIQVKGTVYDSDGMPLPGVNILVQVLVREHRLILMETILLVFLWERC